MTGTVKHHANALYTVAAGAYVLGVTGLAVLLGLSDGGSTALWIVLFASTAPCSFVLAPAAAVLLVGLAASFGAASSFVVQTLMTALWVASWSGIAAVNLALMAPGPGSRLGRGRPRAQDAVSSLPGKTPALAAAAASADRQVPHRMDRRVDRRRLCDPGREGLPWPSTRTGCTSCSADSSPISAAVSMPSER